MSETCLVLKISFLQSLKLKEWSIERGNLWKKSLEMLRSGKALVHRLGLCLECCEKVSHHELQAARAEQERKILQEEVWRQQQDFREVHQQNLTEMKELQKFQSSTFNTNTIMELSGRLQELQNEDCMNDSKDFQDAESVRSGNSHVTSQPGVFPKHPPFEGLLRPSFVSPRRTDGPPNIWDTSGISGNVFANPHRFLILKN